MPAEAVRRLPTDLPDDLAVDMVRAYQSHAREGLRGHVEAMRAAYRVFLDRVDV